jgi:DNA-binding protein H-NS
MARVLSLKVIRRRIQRLQEEAERITNAEKPGIKELRGILRKFKLGLRDVKVALNGHNGRVSKVKDRKVKPKYRNPDKRSETWTGRGRMLVWMAGLVKKGKKPRDFLIERA